MGGSQKRDGYLTKVPGFLFLIEIITKSSLSVPFTLCTVDERYIYGKFHDLIL